MIAMRFGFIRTIFLIWTIIIALRLGHLQVLKSSELKLLADQQHSSSLTIPAPRGLILASDGFPLVGNTENFLLYVNPRQIPDDLSQLINLMESQSTASAQLLKTIDKSNLSWVPISKSISPDLKKIIEAFKYPGLGFEPFPVRLYPESSTSAHITGFVGRSENNLPQGYFGLEGYYDRLLSGSSGRLISEKDAFGLPIVIGSTIRVPPKPGDTIKTSIDRTVQFIAHSQLMRGLKKYRAASGTVTILDSKTGRVLAMATHPGYDPANYAKFDPFIYKNPIISDAYEPGSTFKVLIMAAGLDAGVVDRDTICSSCHGPVTIADKVIKNWNDKYFPQSTMQDVIRHSDNVGMVFVAKKLGKKKTYEYLQAFGLGRPTGIDLQEESSPPLRPDSKWYDIDLATIAFGQGIAVTPLQMTVAVNVIANRGYLITPSLATEVISGDGQIRHIKTTHSKMVISQSAAAKITEMMVNAVNTGAVSIHKPPGYLIAGKTGTAQVPIEGHYDKNKVIASFVGFAPADDPKFTMLVTLSEPKASPWGSTTAAPLWFSIASELFRYFRITGYNHTNI